nr:hypothetical protein [Tanacetum cinerariifolium]
MDYRLNPLYPIKECSSCGALYNTDYCFSEGSLRDKIICDLNKTPDLFQEPPQNFPKCGNPVDGQYYQGYTSEPSDYNTNIVNASQEPFFVKQDPGENSSQSTPHINHHCCYGCGDSVEDIFCHQCTCEFCGKGAHYGYNCTPKVSVVSNSEPCHNQNVDELPQTLPSFDPTCYPGDGNSFTYDAKSNLVGDSPKVFNPPSQPLTYSYEFCGNDAYYGQDVMKIVIPKVGGIDADILLTIKDDILRENLLNINLLIANIEALKDNPNPYSDFMTKSFFTSLNFLFEETNTFDNSLPEFETFCFDLEEIISGSTTTR